MALIHACNGVMDLEAALDGDGHILGMKVRDIADVPSGEGEVAEAELGLAVQLIEQIASESFDPSKYEDEVGQRMLEAVERKVEDGTEIAAPVEEETTAQVIDLMAALRASVGGEDQAEREPEKKKATGS